MLSVPQGIAPPTRATSGAIRRKPSAPIRIGGCAATLKAGTARRLEPELVVLQSVDQAGFNQQPVEPARFGAGIAGIEHAPAPQHDLLLLLE
jgi:hypothetical protein